MNRLIIFVLLQLFILNNSAAQSNDSIIHLKEISVYAYPSHPLLLHSTGTISTLNTEEISDQAQQSLVPVFNSQAGVRMEERSPASYRLSIRGSLIRSPFGIRNVKIYYDEFPITDAGGNTYLNTFDPMSIKNIEILKGPEGSMFGANTGGVIILNPDLKHDTAETELMLKAGSFGLYHEQFSAKRQIKNYSIEINEAIQHCDGYRVHSAMDRYYFQMQNKLKYRKGEVKIMLLHSQLNYETPGALTADQFDTNPKSARPATSKLPGSEEQRAAVFNNTSYGGVSNELNIFKNLSHVITLYGSYTDFKNPFITNYEKRYENTLGLRTFLNLKEQYLFLKMNWNLGYESTTTNSSISNFENNKGNKGELFSHDHLSSEQSFIFSQLTILVKTRFQLELSGSLNNSAYEYRNIFPIDEGNGTKKNIHPLFLPRVGVSYRIINNLVWRASVSEGYSPPTLAEIRPSGNITYNSLQPEFGWNYETGLRYKSFSERINIDLAVFKFDLQNTIVRRVHEDGSEYFMNSGGTIQKGIELQADVILKQSSQTSFIRSCNWRNSVTVYDFKFHSYVVAENDYSGNKITGVPDYTFNSSIKVSFPYSFDLFINYNYTSAIPLADDNKSFSNELYVVGLNADKKIILNKKYSLTVFCGVDNLLNEKYSLGNDLNASAGRYYNAAPGRNYYAGLKLNYY